MHTAGRQKFSVLIESKDFARPLHSHSNSILSTRRFEKEPLYNSRQCLATTSVLDFWNFRLMLAKIRVYCEVQREFLAFIEQIDLNRIQRALVPCAKLLYHTKITGKYDKSIFANFTCIIMTLLCRSMAKKNYSNMIRRKKGQLDRFEDITC